jgi:translation initiation factor 6
MALKISYYGNPFIGLFFKANDKALLCPHGASESVISQISSALGVPPVRTNLCGSGIDGIYCAMNNKGIVVPKFAEKSEIKALEDAGLSVYASAELNNAHGNNICANDSGGIANPAISQKELGDIGAALEIELAPCTIAGHSAVGSACACTGKGFVAHYRATDEELAAVQAVLKVPGDKGTINGGAGCVGAGIVHNSKGFAAGAESTGFELGRVESALGYI